MLEKENKWERRQLCLFCREFLLNRRREKSWSEAAGMATTGRRLSFFLILPRFQMQMCVEPGVFQIPNFGSIKFPVKFYEINFSTRGCFEWKDEGNHRSHAVSEEAARSQLGSSFLQQLLSVSLSRSTSSGKSSVRAARGGVVIRGFVISSIRKRRDRSGFDSHFRMLPAGRCSGIWTSSKISFKKTNKLQLGVHFWLRREEILTFRPYLIRRFTSLKWSSTWRELQFLSAQSR